MQPLRLTRKQVREVDRLAVEQYGVPGIVLMENAGINAAAAILDLVMDDLEVHPTEAAVGVVCGGGNNGGDGYVIARHLHIWGVNVKVWSTRPLDKLKGDAVANAQACSKLGIEIAVVMELADVSVAAKAWAERDVLVDALLGTGFRGEVRDFEASVIEAVNGCERARVVAVDVPSGLDCDSGKPANATVRAAMTVTFVAAKLGFDAEEAAEWTGHVIEADIGIPLWIAERVARQAGN